MVVLLLHHRLHRVRPLLIVHVVVLREMGPALVEVISVDQLLDVAPLFSNSVFTLQFWSLVQHELVLRLEDLLAQDGRIPAVGSRVDLPGYSLSLGVLAETAILCEWGF